MQEYFGVLLREKQLYQGYLQGTLTSIYLGGGTPSLLSAGQILMLLEGLIINSDTEITLEINPLQITCDYLSELAKTPVNRLSIGLQSMDDKQLAWLGRRHRADQMEQKISWCREFGYRNLSLDLIYGLPEAQCEIGLQENLQAFLSLKPQHLSCYLLSLEEDCALAAEGPSLPGDDQLSRQYYTICDTLSEAGLLQYEISNFSLPGHTAKHNLAYWKSSDYLAWGASAAGWIRPHRYQNPAGLKDYYHNVKASILFPEAENCSLEQEQCDWLMMGLRLNEGIRSNDFVQRFNCDLPASFWAKADQLERLGMLELGSGKVALSKRARFVSNSVIGELIQCI